MSDDKFGNNPGLVAFLKEIAEKYTAGYGNSKVAVIPKSYLDVLQRKAKEVLEINRKREETSTALDRLASLNEDKSNIPQSVFVIEECSELIKELTKGRRGKGSEKDVLAEACDVLTSVFVLLRLMHASEDYILDSIIYKCNRAVERFNETGKF